MAQQIADRRDVDFVLFEQMKADELSKFEIFADFNRKTMDLVLSEARNLAIKEILPAYMEGDRQGCKLENGKVKVPECFHRPYKLYCEGEWLAMPDDPEVGGQGLPVVLTQACSEYFVGANMPFIMYPGLTHGAGTLVHEFGTEKQKKLYLKKMFSGKWGGTMLLTEPDAGTDVGNLSTTARKNADGTYSITGNKIFISGGDSDLVENIIHPVLARIEGAPAGTKGISLFLVPKIWVNDDGSLGEDNDVAITAIEEKMGIHGSSTCQMALGGKGKCRGTLLGEENKGMRAMFLMMNEARLGVGIQGYAMSSAAYMHALDYARQRKQGRSLLQFMNPDAPPVSIIEHPDVRRMLLNMKAYICGMRSMIYFVGKCFDIVRTTKDQAEKDKYQGLIEVMIPVLKSYCTDKAFDVCSMAMQTFGGYGYTQDYPVEQLLRDTKITAIYEGTNGVQAMDLLGRKLGMKGGKPLMDLMGEMKAVVAQARKVEALSAMADKVDAAVNRLGEVAMKMGQTAMSDKVLTAFSYASPFLEVTGDVVLAWMHLWRAVISQPKLDGKEKAFYEGQIKTCAYWTNFILPTTMGKMNAIMNMDCCIAEITDDNFGAR